MNIKLLILSVETYVQHRLPEYIEELRKLCSIDTYSYHKTGLDEMARYLAARMRGLGIDSMVVERERWGNDLLGVIHGEGSGKVLLLGHTDTVYPVGTASSRPLRIEGDTILGPGVCDMKGCILSAIYAVEALLATGYRSFGELRFLCVSDEEITTRHSKDILQSAYQDCDAALVLEAARENGDIVSARKGTAWYKLTARGQAAHAGVDPARGRNAILEMAHQIVQSHTLNGWRTGLAINPGVTQGGTAPNTVPEFAEVRFDLRFLHPLDRIDAEEHWKKLMVQQLVPGVELTLELDAEIRDPMVRTAESLKLAAFAQEIAGLLGISINHVLTGGSSDAAYAFGYGVPALDGLGPIGGGDHSPHEYLEASSIPTRAALLAGLIAGIGTRSAY